MISYGMNFEGLRITNLITTQLFRYVGIGYHPRLLQATVARGSAEHELRLSTQTLTQAIADYRQSAKSAKSLENQSKPKPKNAAKAKAKAAA